jgi:hypothetical protein
LGEQGNEGEDDDDDDGEESVGSWGGPASPFRAHLRYGAQGDTDGEDGLYASEEDEEELRESDEDEEVGEWDPPVSSFQAQQREMPHYQEEEGEEEDDGGGCEWLDPVSFLQSQEGVTGACSTTTAAMEEILVFARSLSSVAAAGELAFAEFLNSYSHKALNEEVCVELLRRMSEEELKLGCAHLFQWLLKNQPVHVSQQVWLAGIVALGRCRMADEVLEIVAMLPSEREFREAAVYNAAISAVAYCDR